MTDPRLKSALILLNNAYFENKKFTRKAFAKKLDEENIGNSPQKISSLIKYIIEIFGIELSFKFNKNTVTIIEDDQNNYHFIKALLFHGKLKRETLNTENHFISFSAETNVKNFSIIFDVYEAIIQTKKIKIDYKNFYGVQTKDIVLKPFLLKEYLGRWYLIAEKDDENIKVYGLERITGFEVLSKSFEPNIKAIELYKNTIGVNYSEKVELIKLWVEDYQLKLLETTPLHSSQKIIERHADYGIITLEVSVNYELKQLLASYIHKVKVLEPKSLQMDMIEIFKSILKNYK